MLSSFACATVRRCCNKPGDSVDFADAVNGCRARLRRDRVAKSSDQMPLLEAWYTRTSAEMARTMRRNRAKFPRSRPRGRVGLGHDAAFSDAFAEVGGPNLGVGDTGAGGTGVGGTGVGGGASLPGLTPVARVELGGEIAERCLRSKHGKASSTTQTLHLTRLIKVKDYIDWQAKCDHSINFHPGLVIS